jgi:hypothetical protein
MGRLDAGFRWHDKPSLRLKSVLSTIEGRGISTIPERDNEEPRRKQRGIGSNRSSNRSKLRGINP